MNDHINAIVQCENLIYSIYRKGSDWQIIGPNFERWFSVWRSNELASLMRAVENIPVPYYSLDIISVSRTS